MPPSPLGAVGVSRVEPLAGGVLVRDVASSLLPGALPSCLEVESPLLPGADFMHESRAAPDNPLHCFSAGVGLGDVCAKLVVDIKAKTVAADANKRCFLIYPRSK
jgi:hypothetical protein